MDENQEQALAQMRKSVQMLGSSTEKYGDPILMRFLIARSMDTDKASKMFVQWQKWRAAFVPLGQIPESEVEDELNAKKIYLQGLSEKGYPVMVVKSNKHFPSKDQLQFKKFVVYLLDKTIASSFKGREIGNEKLIGIIDLKQISYKNIDARGLITGFQYLQIDRCFLSKSGEILSITPRHFEYMSATEQAYYPERLAKLYLLHMPWFFVSVWRLVSRFLEKATLEKVVIVKNEEEIRDLVKEIGEDALAEEYGGRAKLVPIQDFVLMPLEDSAL